MEEGAVADESLRWIVAENHAVDAGKVAVALGVPDGRPAEFLGRFLRESDALWRCRVRRQEIRLALLRGTRGAVIGVPRHGGQEARRGVGVVAGGADGLDADGVGLEFLLLRKRRER